MIINALKKSKTLAKPLSIFVDKLNRKEYLKFSRYELRYKIYSSGMFTLISKEDLQQLPISATKKRLMLKDINLMFYEHQEERITISNIAGTLLCDFVNCNFSNYNSVTKFIEKYSIVILIEMLREKGYKIELKSLYTKEEYEDIILEIVAIYKNVLEEIKSDFIFDIDNCYNIYNEESKMDLTPYQIYTVALCSNKGSRTFRLYNSEKIYLECDNDMTSFDNGLIYSKEKHVIENIKVEREKIIPSPYIITSLDLKQILFIEFKELLCIDKFPIKKCRNCDKYFVPYKRTDELYCNNIFEDTGKPCKEVGFFAFNQRRLKEDDIARLYRNTYQQKLLRAKRNPNNTIYIYDLERFKFEYKEIKEKMSNGEMSKEEFKEWLLKRKK